MPAPVRRAPALALMSGLAAVVLAAAVLTAILAIRGLRIDGTLAPRPHAAPLPERGDRAC